MGVPQMYRCPNCRADGDDIDWSGSFFYIYECSDCEERFCYRVQFDLRGPG
jgi:hypothetical protein